jgi:SAM-dependent methyltransferase
MDEQEIAKSAALEQSHWWYAGRRALIRRMLRGVVPGRAVDIGSGSGGNTAVLRDLGWDVSALEWSPTAARLVAARGIPTVRGDARRLPFAEGSVDLVLSTDLWEHVVEDDQVAAEAFRVLRPGGRLLVAVPAGQVLWSGHDVALGHVRRYERDTLQARVAGAGFDVVDVRSWNVLLRPVARLRRSRQSEATSEMAAVHPVLNLGLRAVLRLEATLPVARWPGISLVARARKRASQ